MHTEAVHYQADGLAMIGHLVRNDAQPGRRPGVLVFPEGGGLGEHAKSRAARIAAEFGYVALACDLYGGGEAMTDFASVMPRLNQIRGNAAKVRALTQSAHTALAARPDVDPTRIAAIGFCFGGTLAYELALTGAPIKAAIGFHGGLTVSSPQDAGQIKAKVLALLGADDPAIPPEQRDAFVAMLRAAGVDWQMTLYGGVVHSFTNQQAAALNRPDFARYDATADARSWRQMSDLFAETLG